MGQAAAFVDRDAQDVPYYVRNFLSLIHCVLDRYGDLLSADEQQLIRRLDILDPNARRLYVRLICRKGPVFRCDRLDYPEIDVRRALDRLSLEGLLERRPELPLRDLLSMLTVAELKALLADLGASRLGRKLELVERLVEYESEFPLASYLDWCTPLRQCEMELFQLLFFGNDEQSLTDFILEEIGVVRHESYRIDAAQRLFDDRCTVEELRNLYRLGDESKAHIEQGENQALGVVRDALWESRTHPELERKRSRILNRIGHYFERRKAFDDALSAYARSGLPPARERRARILTKLADESGALRLCEAILLDPHDEFEERFGAQFGARIRGEKRRRPQVVPLRRLWLAHPPMWPVEEVAVRQLENEGWCAYYVENHLPNALFGLAFWDVIFHPLKGVFHHPFQFGPSDLFRPQFRAARATLIDERLREIEAGEVDRILCTYDAKHGIANALVNWRRLERDVIERALECIPGTHLCAIFDRLSRDLARNRSGFPDLLLLDPISPQYKFVEVKGMGDRLQIHQSRWMAHFIEHDIPAELMRIVWS